MSGLENQPGLRDYLGDLACLVEALHRFSQQLARLALNMARKIANYLQLPLFTDGNDGRLTESTVLGFIFFAMASCCFFPVIVFAIFAVASIMFTCMGFLFVEGSILLIGYICCIAWMLSLILAASVTAVLVGTSMIIFFSLGKLIYSCEFTQNLIYKIVTTLNGGENFEMVSGNSVDSSSQN